MGLIFRAWNTVKIETPYGVKLKLSYFDKSSESVKIQHYTIGSDFIFMYEQGKSEPTLVISKSSIDAIITLDEPNTNN